MCRRRSILLSSNEIFSCNLFHPGMMHSVYLLCGLAHEGEGMTTRNKVKLSEFIRSIGTIIIMTQMLILELLHLALTNNNNNYY